MGWCGVENDNARPFIANENRLCDSAMNIKFSDKIGLTKMSTEATE